MNRSKDMSFIEVEETHRGYLTEMLTGDEFSERILGNIDVSVNWIWCFWPTCKLSAR